MRYNKPLPAPVSHPDNEGGAVPIECTGRKEGSGRLRFDRYIGADVTALLNEARSAIAQSSGGRN